MAQTLLQGLIRFRFLLVAALALTLLSSPLLSRAGTEKSTVRIVDAPSVVAGMSSELTLQGDPYANLEVNILKPDKSSLILETVADAKGKAYLSVSDYHLRTAGVYKVSSRELGKDESYGVPGSFEVYAGPVSETTSQVDFSKNSAELGETVEMTVSLLDAYRNEIDGHVLKVIPSSNVVSVYTPEFATDDNGHMNFYLSSSKKGIYTFTIYDSSVNKTLSATPKLAFSGSGNFAEVGGHDDDDVVLAAGSLDSFVITGLEDGVIAGDETTVTVKAIDEDGFTVTDYTGTIRFSATDSEATLPNDYTFLAEDQGEHSFSLAVKLVTPGTQTLTVTDVDEFSITGEAEVEVSTSEDSAVDYGETFETTDFTREGDFSLISPAPGSYSQNTIEVQGEAEYGYTAFVWANDEVMGHTDVEFDNTFSYTLTELDDGTYEVYVDIVDVSIANAEDFTDEEIDELYAEGEDEDSFTLIETSDSEEITVDTTGPELVSIEIDEIAEAGIVAGQTVSFTVLSEADLEEASILFNEEVYTMTETSTSGKYETDITMPETEGDYGVDVLLMDSLGNEVQHRDQLTLTVGAAAAEEETEEETTEEETEEESTVSGVSQVTGVTATGAEETVYLSWEEPESENAIAYYRVYYGPSEDSLYAVSETFDSSTSWSISDLTGEEIYYFAVTAVDVEGTEGEVSEAVLGVPTLASEAAEEDEIDDTSETPEISGSEEEIEETPETGPTENALMLVSLLGALGYMAAKKRRAFVKSF